MYIYTQECLEPEDSVLLMFILRIITSLDICGFVDNRQHVYFLIRPRTVFKT